MCRIISGIRDYLSWCKEMNELDNKIGGPEYSYPEDTIRFHELNLKKAKLVRKVIKGACLVIGIICALAAIDIKGFPLGFIIAMVIGFIFYGGWKLFLKGDNLVDDIIKVLKKSHKKDNT